jgi:hypothetical protein
LHRFDFCVTMRKVILILLLFVLTATVADAQRWKRYRHEIWGGVGATSMLAELGGGPEEASDLFFDINGNATRFAIAGGYRYKLNEVISTRANLAFAQLHGSDALSKDYHRQSRNITVSTTLIELSAVGEAYFIKEKFNNRYSVRGIRGALGSTLSAYVMGGIGAFYYNPRGQHNGLSYSLRPMGTEGQGLDGYDKKYSRFSFCIPMGVGAKFNLTKQFALNFEYSFRVTFTDYLDDTSTKYPDAVAVADANGGLGTADGDAAYYFSNPAIEVNDFLAGGTVPQGQQRGDKTTKDTYMFALIGLSYKFVSKKSNRPKF